MRLYLNKNWAYTEEYKDSYQSDLMGDEAVIVTLPHTNKELPFNCFNEKDYQFVSCYQKQFKLEEGVSGKDIELTFEGVAQRCEVFINGKFVCENKSGYNAFSAKINEFVNFGETNLLTVKVDSRESVNQPPFGFVIDYLTYGGIYRDVYLDIREKTHIQDVFFMPKVDSVNTKGMTKQQIAEVNAFGILELEVLIENYKEGLSARVSLGDKVYLEQPLVAKADEAGSALVSLKTTVGEIKLWDIESPNRYEATVEIVADGKVIDSFKSKIGFRTAEFKADGFYLNGRKVLIRGLNRHQSYAYVGYAMPESMQRFDAKILKEELALNAVRTSHYQQSHYFIDECDAQGLLVFTEMPGWQHIGNDEWKDIAVQNTKYMVSQYRNHPSIILWGVRINESADDDEFYKRTNEAAHKLDPTRATGGVRCIKNSHLFEDVYTYNDFFHSGGNAGCEKKSKVTSDMSKAYFVSEYNGHMYPTKTFDDEEQRRNHMLRHARVLNDIAAEPDIAGSFGWCMFDYNTHKDFGSGDRICYHGVMDMFRNPKVAAGIYSAQGEENIFLDVTSSMDIGEHPACVRDEAYIVTNADSVKMYKNDKFIKEYKPSESKYTSLKHGPIVIDEYVVNNMAEIEGWKPNQAKLVRDLLNHIAVYGYNITAHVAWIALRLVVLYHMNPGDAYQIYNKYVGDWGGEVSVYKFDAIKNGEVVKTIIKGPMTKASLKVDANTNVLKETHTYDVAALRIKAVDEHGNVLPYYQEPVKISVEGAGQLIGPEVISLKGGMSGAYIKTVGETGSIKVTLDAQGLEPVVINLEVE